MFLFRHAQPRAFIKSVKQIAHMNLFPFDTIRDGQKKFIDEATKAIKKKLPLIVHAPTGIGKTAAALAPAVQYAIENKKKVLFLTPRHAQHKIVIETLKRMAEKYGRKIRVVDLVGKKWLCGLPESEFMGSSEFQDYCKHKRKNKSCALHKNTYPKKDNELNETAKDVIRFLDHNILHSDDAKNICKEYCPYEIFSQRAKKADVIIADYFHIFHPKIRNAFLNKINTDLKNIILIVDEAHNLPARARDLLSSQLTDTQISRASSEAKEAGFDSIGEDLDYLKMKLTLFSKKKLVKSDESYVNKKDVLDAINSVRESEEFCEYLDKIATETHEQKKRSYCASLSTFINSWSTDEIGYTRIIKKRFFKDKTYYVFSLECLDPGIATKDVFSNLHSTILMSGTLIPTSMYGEVLGITNANTLILKTPFPKENRKTLVFNDVTTKYSARGDAQFEKIGKYIVKIANKTPGNIGVFFPSYFMQTKIYELIWRSLDKTVLIERKGMSKNEKFEMYDEYIKLSKKGAVLFGVVGANFSEGVDFPGDLMNAVVLVGLPLERPDLLSDALIKYYDLKFSKGWEYGYTYPAMNRAMQAAGRCIRSEKDRGMIHFLDSRYLWSNYKKLLPEDYNLELCKDIDQEIKDFFKDKNTLFGFSGVTY